MSIDVLTTVYIANAIGIALLLTLFFSNRAVLEDNRDLKTIYHLIGIAFFACLADPIVYTVDGRPGKLNTFIIYAGNSWLYLAIILTAKLWLKFMTEHLNLSVSRASRNILDALLVFGLLCIGVNIAHPIIFSVVNNVYRREALYWVYVMIAAVYLVFSMYLYHKAVKRGGVLKFFPVDVFMVPVIVAVLVQSFFYGISVIWTGVPIAIAGIMTAMKNETIFMDRLTGIYNRTYLDYLQKGIYKRKNNYITGIMIDLNGFKSINDRFGHAAGDEALIISADIFSQIVGDMGNVIRYAGDEFVVLLNTVEEKRVEEIIEKMHKAMREFNQSGEKPYQLSASMGYAAMDLKNQSMNDFMNMIDKKMYEDKARYYRSQQEE